ncbi:Ankyrin repeat and SAM domain-containing protein [Drosera capensis]
MKFEGRDDNYNRLEDGDDNRARRWLITFKDDVCGMFHVNGGGVRGSDGVVGRFRRSPESTRRRKLRSISGEKCRRSRRLSRNRIAATSAIVASTLSAADITVGVVGGRCAMSIPRITCHCRNLESTPVLGFARIATTTPREVVSDAFRCRILRPHRGKERLITEATPLELVALADKKLVIYKSELSKNNDAVSSVDRVDLVTESVSRLDIENDDGEVKNGGSLLQQPNSTGLECKCGMPLCICVPSVPEPMPLQIQSTPQASAIPKPKRPDDISRNKGANQDMKQNSSSGLGSSASGVVKPRSEYEVNGEGLREAIKNGDIAAVEELLDKGVDSNYCDKQGFSLLHLAALFNQTDIVFALMDCGARLDSKNSQGETPLDCAPVMLQFKMRKKMEDVLS